MDDRIDTGRAYERLTGELERRLNGGAPLPLGPTPDVAVPRQDAEASAILDRGGIVRSVEGPFPVLEPGDDLSILDPEGLSLLLSRVRASGGEPTLSALQLGDRRDLLLAGRGDDDGSIRLTLPRPVWTALIEDTLADLYDLTVRERQVLAALTDGMSVSEFADASGRSQGTIRQQVKAILAKLGVRSQAQAIALMSRVVAAQPATTAVTSPLEQADLNGEGGWRRFGLRGGMPVLFFHGSLFGIGARDEERAAAEHIGLDVIAPERPGYGTTPFPAHRADVVPQAVAKAVMLLDRLDIDRVVVLAHEIGTPFAFAFAAAHPRRVAGIVAGPTTPPMTGWAQTAGMPSMHRINALAAQRFPALMDRIVVLALSQIARKGPQSIPGFVFADSAFDRERWEEVLEPTSSQDTLRLISAQDAQGFRNDMRLTNTDWSEVARQVECPAHLVHGARSGTVAQTGVERLANLMLQGLATVEVRPDEGHTLPLTDAAHLLRACARLGAISGLMGR